MDFDPYSHIVLFVVLLGASAFFSGSETAFFSIGKHQLGELKNKNNVSANRILSLLNHPRQLLITILIGNTLVNVGAASIGYMLTIFCCRTAGLPEQWSIIINIVVVTFVILLFSEITPKIIAVKNPIRFSGMVAPLVYLLFLVFYPITFLSAKMIDVLKHIFQFSEATLEKYMRVEEFQTLLNIGEQQGELETDEKEILNSIFQFGDTTVREIMIPRTDMVCVSDDISIDELSRIIKEKGHTRIPVYSETVDKIQGIINAKDLLPFIYSPDTSIDILSLARTAIFVQKKKKIDDLLREFQMRRQHMAIVVDEYGGTSGLVTLEDVIEEIVGEIQDEYDKEPPLYRQINSQQYLFNSKIDIHSVNELLTRNIPTSEDYDTLSGFILEHKGYFPKEGETLEFEDLKFTMEKVEKNRILLIRVDISLPQEERDV